MPFTKQEAQEWAKHLNEVEGKAVELETWELVKDIREAIGRDAEAGDWYDEWCQIQAEAELHEDAELDDPWKLALATMRDRAKRLPLLPSDYAHERAYMKELDRVAVHEVEFMDVDKFEVPPEKVPMTVPELIGIVIDKIEKAADNGKHYDYYSVSLNHWPALFEEHLLLTKSDAQRVADFFSGYGFDCTVDHQRNALTPGWMVKIAW